MNKLLIVLLLVCASTMAQERVVVSVKPLHSLVSAVAGKNIQVDLLLKQDVVHGVQLKPSMIKSIHKAAAVFYIDRKHETFLAKVLTTLPENIKTYNMSSIKDLLRLKIDGQIDYHLMLSPTNAIMVANFINNSLSALYPQYKDNFAANTAKLLTALKALDQQIASELAAVKNAPFIVFHQAYGYFIHHYGLNFQGRMANDHHTSTSIKSLRALRAKIKRGKIKCAFGEVKMNDKLFNAVIDGNLKVEILDPAGLNLKPGADLYFKLMRNLVSGFRACLQQKEE